MQKPKPAFPSKYTGKTTKNEKAKKDWKNISKGI